MKIYEVYGTITTNFVVYIEADTQDDAVRVVEAMDAVRLRNYRLSSSVEDVYCEGETTNEPDISLKG